MTYFWHLIVLHPPLNEMSVSFDSYLHGLQGLSEGVIEASSFRTSYVPLNKQEDFIKGMQACPPLHGCPFHEVIPAWVYQFQPNVKWSIKSALAAFISAVFQRPVGSALRLICLYGVVFVYRLCGSSLPR